MYVHVLSYEMGLSVKKMVKAIALNHGFSFSPLLTYLSQASPCSLGLFYSEQEEPDKERNVEENAQIPVKLGPDLYQLMAQDSPPSSVSIPG